MGDFSYSITQISPQRQDASTSSGVAASAVTNGYYSNGSNLSSPSGQHRTQHETYGMFSQYHQQPENRASPKRRVSNASMAVRTAHLGPEYTPQELAGTDPAHRMGVIQESSDPSSQSRAAYRPFYPHSAIADASSDSTHAQRPHDGEQYPDWHAQRPPQSSSGQVPIWSYSVNHHSRNTSGGTIHPQAIHLSNPSQLAPQGLLANGLSTYPSYNVSNTYVRNASTRRAATNDFSTCASAQTTDDCTEFIGDASNKLLPCFTYRRHVPSLCLLLCRLSPCFIRTVYSPTCPTCCTTWPIGTARRCYRSNYVSGRRKANIWTASLLLFQLS